MRVLVALSGGVDSSVAAALLKGSGHDVVGATMKLWGGSSDSGCCSVADVEDARAVARVLSIEHHVFNFGDEFEAKVVGPYVAAHAAGLTPNPCVECNRHIKFAAFLDRAVRLGFDAVATGHHARVVPGAAGAGPDRRPRLLRGLDARKDQSYVLSCLSEHQLERLLLPIGELDKAEVRRIASSMSLPTAGKPDSQEVCFVGRAGTAARRRFLEARLELQPGRLVDVRSGEQLGTVPALELLTVGQRRGLGIASPAPPGAPAPSGAGQTGRDRRRFVIEVDTAAGVAFVGGEPELASQGVRLVDQTRLGAAVRDGARLLAQASAHGEPFPVRIEGDLAHFVGERRRIAPGQIVALYERDEVVGSGVAAREAA